MMDSDHTDMIIRVYTIPLANMPMECQSSISDIEKDSRGSVVVANYFWMAKTNGCWTSCLTFLPPTSAGRKRIPGRAFLTARAKSSCEVLSTLNDPFSARPVVSTTNWASTSPYTQADLRISGYRGADDQGA